MAGSRPRRIIVIGTGKGSIHPQYTAVGNSNGPGIVIHVQILEIYPSAVTNTQLVESGNTSRRLPLRIEPHVTTGHLKRRSSLFRTRRSSQQRPCVVEVSCQDNLAFTAERSRRPFAVRADRSVATAEHRDRAIFNVNPNGIPLGIGLNIQTIAHGQHIPETFRCGTPLRMTFILDHVF